MGKVRARRRSECESNNSTMICFFAPTPARRPAFHSVGTSSGRTAEVLEPHHPSSHRESTTTQ